MRVLALAYGLVCYAVFFVTFLYSAGFVGNFVVPKTIDSGNPASSFPALLVDLGLLGIFAVQHSAMARRAFKRVWTRLVPPAVERSTYVLFSSLALALLYWQWRPMTEGVWRTEGAAAAVLTALQGLGWLIVLLATFMIGHFDLFGLKQVVQNLRGRAYQEPGFTARGFYAIVRHPLQTGFLIAFWACPVMTRGHLLFAVATTLYILAALQLEERDLLAALGQTYAEYRRRVPMLFPWKPRRAAPGATAHSSELQ
jgi:protein-S-isoprenylcysteine O-methyltransferase Ste14